jgi:hypothetical protein
MRPVIRLLAKVALPALCVAVLALHRPALAESELTCKMLWKQAELAKPQQRALYSDFARRCPNHPQAAEARRRALSPPPPSRASPPRQTQREDPCRTAKGHKTSVVVVGRQSLDERALAVLAREMGCERFSFKMGRTTYPGRPTNLVAFGPNPPFRDVQLAIRGAFKTGAPIAYLGFGAHIPAKTVWIAHVDLGLDSSPLTGRDWAAFAAASTQALFDSLIEEKGTELERKPGHR